MARKTALRLLHNKQAVFKLVTSLLLLTSMTSPSLGNVITSSEKIQGLVERETILLDALQKHINEEYDNLKALSEFLWERWRAGRLRSLDEVKRQTQHPNGAYLLVKLFVLDWHHVMVGNPSFDMHTADLRPSLPTPGDFQGACSALVRLQRVYGLRVDDMYAGNYSGYEGPALKPDDAYEIGRQAFTDGHLQESRDWLHLAVTKLGEQDGAGRGGSHFLLTTMGQAYGLLGRTYYFMNDAETAQEIYDIGRQLDSEVTAHMAQLQRELSSGEGGQDYWFRDSEWDDVMADLCGRNRGSTVETLKPDHTCRCKQSFSSNPFVCHKEEILSISPFISLFYDVISDSEIEALTGLVKDKMARGLVGKGLNASTAYFRTSDLGWVYDGDLGAADTLAVRVKDMTGLEVNQSLPAGPTSEAFQIVNYGLGGHYDVHMDPFDNLQNDSSEDEDMEYGERLATFLMYGMALFWYNFDPKMEKDLNTVHAGCPVLIGQKWIANKWIWTQGNEFRRPCGPSPLSTQQDVDLLMCGTHRH